jgi:hypothetical protein
MAAIYAAPAALIPRGFTKFYLGVDDLLEFLEGACWEGIELLDFLIDLTST